MNAWNVYPSLTPFQRKNKMQTNVKILPDLNSRTILPLGKKMGFLMIPKKNVITMSQGQN